jgi:nucleoside-diphosphate-sugar epimerase
VRTGLRKTTQSTPDPSSRRIGKGSCNDWKGVRSVTGGAGFIGSHLCRRLLADGCEVLCVDNYLAKRLKAKIFQASTSEVYGDPKVHPQPESYWGNVNPIGKRSCYDEGKRCAESLFSDYHRQHKLRVKVARIFNTYGPQRPPEACDGAAFCVTAPSKVE